MVVHATPGFLRICAVVTRSGLSALEAGSRSGELHIDQTAVVDSSLDCVSRGVLTQLNRDAICVEGVVSLIETVVGQSITRPEEGLLVVGVEELGVELHRRTEAGDVVINDLQESNVTRVRVEVEGLCLNVGIVQGLPFEVLLGQLGESRLAGVLSNRLDCLGTVDGLFCTGDGGQAVRT